MSPEPMTAERWRTRMGQLCRALADYTFAPVQWHATPEGEVTLRIGNQIAGPYDPDSLVDDGADAVAHRVLLDRHRWKTP